MIDKWQQYMQKAREMLQQARQDTVAKQAQAQAPQLPQGASNLPSSPFQPPMDRLIPGARGPGNFNIPSDVVEQMGGQGKLYDFIKALRSGGLGGLL